MESKERQEAKRLVQCLTDLIFNSGNTVSKPMVKDVAAFCVEEMLDLQVWESPHNTPEGKLYWQQVLTEIKSL